MKESVHSYYHCSFAPLKAKLIYIQSTIILALLQLCTNLKQKWYTMSSKLLNHKLSIFYALNTRLSSIHMGEKVQAGHATNKEHWN